MKFLIVIAILLMPSMAFAQRNILQDAARRNDVNAPNRPAGPPSIFTDAAGKSENPIEKLANLSLPDFQYAAALADASGNKITAPCWHAWVDLISKQQQQLKGPDGQPMTQPDPHLFTDVEKFSELVQSLQQGGPIQVGCAALADAARKSVAQLISTILTGGGLTGLIPVLPIIP